MAVGYKKTAIVFSFFVLMGIAVALGLAVFRRLTIHKIDAPTVAQSQQRNDFTADEKALLKTPPRGASEAEKAAHFTVVNRLAQTKEFLDLSTCFGNPLAFRVQGGTTFTVKNTAAVAHTLQISPKYVYTIPPLPVMTPEPSPISPQDAPTPLPAPGREEIQPQALRSS